MRTSTTMLLSVFAAFALHAAAQNTPAHPSIPEIKLAAADAMAPTMPSAPDAWGGARDQPNAALSDQVVSYTIQAELNPDTHLITAKQTMTWRNRSQQAVDTIYLHLYLNAFSGMDSTFMQEQVALRIGSGAQRLTEPELDDGEWGFIDLQKIVQAGEVLKLEYVQPDHGPKTDRTVARVKLAQAVPAGATLNLQMDFLSQLPRVHSRTGYFKSFHMVAQWFPKIAVLELPGERGATEPRWNAHEFHALSEFYADFGSYDVSITVPTAYRVGATGVLTGPVLNKNGKSTHRFVQSHVIDFAWAADQNFVAPLQATWINRYDNNRPVNVQVFYPSEYLDAAKISLSASLEALDYFSKTLGAYPYDSVTAIVPPFNAEDAAGMEYPTLFTTAGAKDIRPNSLTDYELEFVTVHEFGHGYFMGILASNEFEEPFLDEGLNEFWDTRWFVEKNKRFELMPAWLNRLGISLSFDFQAIERAGAQLRQPSDPLGQNSWRRMSSQGYWPVYSRTTTMLRDIEAKYGKSQMEKAMRAYYQRWKFRHPSAADFKQVLQEQLGDPADIEARFANHVYAASESNDAIVGFSSTEVLPSVGYQPDAKGTLKESTIEALETHLEQVRKDWKKANPEAKAGTGPFPYQTTIVLRREGQAIGIEKTLQVKFADGSQQTAVWRPKANQRWERFEFRSKSKATSVLLDPEQKAYLETSLLDNSKTMEANRGAVRRWGSDLMAAAQSAISLMMGL
jgi:hypothetical protein